MSDNYFKSCPPMMSDGRLFTDYRSNTLVNEAFKRSNRIIDDNEYREFLQKNGSTIIDKEWEHIKNTKYCHVNECVHNYPTRMDPSLFATERKHASSLFDPRRTTLYKCPLFNDSRSTYTTNTTNTFKPPINNSAKRNQ